MGYLEPHNPNEAREKALNWILHEDPLQLNASNTDALLQRFVVVLFYFTTTKNAPWNECNPSAAASGFCYYPERSEFEHYPEYPNSIWGNLWLSSSHECQWAGITCSERNLTILSLSMYYVMCLGFPLYANKNLIF